MKFKDCVETLLVFYRKFTGWCIKVWYSRYPIEDKVVFSNFTGKVYGDNPRYISEELHRIRPDIKQIWIEKHPGSLKTPDYVEKVTHKSMRRRKEYATARVWVDSHSVQLDNNKRKGQYFIETWHGSFQIKKIEGDADMPFYYMQKTRHSSGMADLFISNTRIKTEIYRRAFDYKGEVLECGYPKNDIFFGDIPKMREEILKGMGVDPQKKILFYAPTFRNDQDDWYDLDFDRLKNCLEERFGGLWIIFVRLHPVTADSGRIVVKENDYIMDTTRYPNMQELLVASDIYVTDYSSAVYDFSLMRKPIFLYASDMEIYRKERDLYWDIEKDLPFPLAEDMDAFVDNIANYDEKCYNSGLDKFFDMIGVKESGNAANIVAELISEKISRK